MTVLDVWVASLSRASRARGEERAMSVSQGGRMWVLVVVVVVAVVGVAVVAVVVVVGGCRWPLAVVWTWADEAVIALCVLPDAPPDSHCMHQPRLQLLPDGLAGFTSASRPRVGCGVRARGPRRVLSLECMPCRLAVVVRLRLARMDPRRRIHWSAVSRTSWPAKASFTCHGTSALLHARTSHRSRLFLVGARPPSHDARDPKISTLAQ
jgi:hypothetical protein